MLLNAKNLVENHTNEMSCCITLNLILFVLLIVTCAVCKLTISKARHSQTGH